MLIIEYVAATAIGNSANNAIERKDKRPLPIPVGIFDLLEAIHEELLTLTSISSTCSHDVVLRSGERHHHFWWLGSGISANHQRRPMADRCSSSHLQPGLVYGCCIDKGGCQDPVDDRVARVSQSRAERRAVVHLFPD